MGSFNFHVTGGLIKMFDIINAMFDRSFRDDALNTEIEIDNTTITIDTCCPTDTKKWETGIKRGDEDWAIIEDYESKTEAEKGHNKWVKAVRDSPDMILEDILFEKWVKQIFGIDIADLEE